MLLTALALIAGSSYAVTGASDSLLLLLHIEKPPAANSTYGASNGPTLEQYRYPHNAGKSLGKCSRFSVSCLDHRESLLASAGSTLSVWDVVARQRTRLWLLGASDSANTCGHLTPSLAVCAGNGCMLHVYDFRSTAPVMSLKVGSDNLYSLAVHEDQSISVAGADGAVYRVDLRNQQKETAVLPDRASVLDLKACETGTLATLENGNVCLIPSSGQEYAFSVNVAPKFNHRVGSDIFYDGAIAHIVLGSEDGTVSYWNSSMRLPEKSTVGDKVVSTAIWGPRGIYACAGDLVVVIPRNSRGEEFFADD